MRIVAGKGKKEQKRFFFFSFLHFLFASCRCNEFTSGRLRILFSGGINSHEQISNDIWSNFFFKFYSNVSAEGEVDWITWFLFCRKEPTLKMYTIDIQLMTMKSFSVIRYGEFSSTYTKEPLFSMQRMHLIITRR